MKVKIQIECTPAEARHFGLPNVRPLQAAVLEQFQKKMLAEIDRVSPRERGSVHLSECHFGETMTLWPWCSGWATK